MSFLFSPKNIGSLEIKNRIVRSATYEGMATDNGEITNRHLKMYEDLAKGGTGLIITGHAFVHSAGKVRNGMTGIHEDRTVPGLARLVDTVHKFGGRVAVQINHAGRQIDPKGLDSITPLAPSPVPDPISGTTPKEMSEEEIEETIEAYGLAAGRGKEAGFDAIQIHGAHGYLVSEFISPYTNRRNDRWGGNLQNRMRFLMEVCRSVRKEVGSNYPVFIKLNSEDCLEGGLEVKESLAMAKELEKEGIDAIEVSGGMRESKTGTARTRILSEKKEGYFLKNALEFKKALNIPIILVGGLRSKSVMEKVLNEGWADFVSLCRPLIREPDFPEKMKGGKERADCISCNGCFPRGPGPVQCIQVQGKSS